MFFIKWIFLGAFTGLMVTIILWGIGMILFVL